MNSCLYGEKVNDFITTLYSLVDRFEYGVLHDELVPDKIVVGISDLTGIICHMDDVLVWGCDEVKKEERLQATQVS